MEIREERDADHAEIRRVVDAAFGQQNESALIDTLRGDGELALSIVAEINGRIVGHAALSFMQSPEDSLALAPVAVTPGMQGLGVGSAMIRECITRAWHEEAAILFVLGEPPFYGRFGFNAAEAVAFESPYSGEFWLALIRPGAAPQPGPAVHAKAFAGLA